MFEKEGGRECPWEDQIRLVGLAKPFRGLAGESMTSLANFHQPQLVEVILCSERKKQLPIYFLGFKDVSSQLMILSKQLSTDSSMFPSCQVSDYQPSEGLYVELATGHKNMTFTVEIGLTGR